jgi:hypothetical protein
LVAAAEPCFLINGIIFWVDLSRAIIQSHAIQGLQTFTQYMISLQVFNPEGLGPSSTVIVMTDEGGKYIFFFFLSFFQKSSHLVFKFIRP